VTDLDWIALGFVALNALRGLRRGLVGTALSLAGLVGGAVLGDHVGPHLLAGGARSPYTPVAALVGAAVGALVGRTVASIIASFARGGLRLLPPLHALDTLGGLVAGALSALLVVWVLGAVALEIPDEPGLRRDAQRSEVLRELDTVAPPTTLLHELARIDELPSLAGPAPPAPVSTPGILDDPAVRAAAVSVVRVTAQACGLGVEGSGWVARPHLVVTAAHVVSGGSGILVDGDPARLYAIDRLDDVAVLEVPALTARPLPLGEPRTGQSIAILGYPEDGPFDARPGRIGATVTVEFDGEPRRVTEFQGLVRHGNSGGPVIDAAGTVETTVFAALLDSSAGFGVPTAAVAAALAGARQPVPSGSC
jgi:S1-C subfamily serine protease